MQGITCSACCAAQNPTIPRPFEARLNTISTCSSAPLLIDTETLLCMITSNSESCILQNGAGWVLPAVPRVGGSARRPGRGTETGLLRCNGA